MAAKLIRARGKSTRDQAAITRIVERAPLDVVGVLDRQGAHWIVRPQGKPDITAVRLDAPLALAVQAGDLVVVQLHEESLVDRAPRGELIEVLGPADDARAVIQGMLRRFRLPRQFAPAALAEANEAACLCDAADMKRRTDLRRLLTVTIDPDDARDFDDAISIEPLAGGHLRLGVHIADVAHYVRIDGPLDQAARERGTSAYFPGHAVPMLPECLSNEACSLQPNRDRLTRSVFITYDQQARVTETEFRNSVIRSHARLTYRAATAVLVGDATDIDGDVATLLRLAGRLARRIEKRRKTAGMISLALPEVEIVVGPDGRVQDSRPADASFSHRLIEMFMVEANEAVCRRLEQAELPCLRRNHAEPEADAARALAPLRLTLGDVVPTRLDRPSIRKFLDAVRGSQVESAAHYMLLRAMPQAEYGTSPTGHFALASRQYCHFTSPIRRYPDLVNHRLLDLVVSGQAAKLSATELSDLADTVAEAQQRSNAAERRAVQAERATRQALLLRLMLQHIGEEFDAMITGAIPLGAFVQVQPFLVDGLMRVREFGQDVWEFDDRSGVFRGLRSGRVVSIGQKLRVVIAHVDMVREQLDLVPAADVIVGARLSMKREDANRKQRPRRARR